MITETLNYTYAGGQRIANQKVTYDKSDDLFTLASLQRRYENICREIAAIPAGDFLPEHLTEQKAELEGEIELWEGYIAGYAAEAEVEA